MRKGVQLYTIALFRNQTETSSIFRRRIFVGCKTVDCFSLKTPTDGLQLNSTAAEDSKTCLPSINDNKKYPFANTSKLQASENLHDASLFRSSQTSKKINGYTCRPDMCYYSETQCEDRWCALSTFLGLFVDVKGKKIRLKTPFKVRFVHVKKSSYRKQRWRIISLATEWLEASFFQCSFWMKILRHEARHDLKRRPFTPFEYNNNTAVQVLVQRGWRERINIYGDFPSHVVISSVKKMSTKWSFFYHWCLPQHWGPAGTFKMNICLDNAIVIS